MMSHLETIFSLAFWKAITMRTTKYFIAIITLMTLFSFRESVLASPRPRTVRVESNVTYYQKLFNQLNSTSQVGTDVDFGKLGFWKKLTAPRRVRELLTSWKDSGFKSLTVFYSCDGQRLILTWNLSMRVVEEYDEANPMLTKIIKSYGLKEIKSPVSKHLQNTFRRMKHHQKPPQAKCFYRQTGSVREEVITDVKFGLVGGRNRKHESIVDVSWSVSCPLKGSPPSRVDLTRIVPYFTHPKVPKKDIELWKIVRDQPVYSLYSNSGSGFSGKYPVALRKTYESELTRLGFKLKDKAKHHMGTGVMQYMWHRYIDDTSVDIITLKDKKFVRLSYSPPKQEPRKLEKLDDLTFEKKADKKYLAKMLVITKRYAHPSGTYHQFGGWDNSRYHQAYWKSTKRYDNWMWSSIDYSHKPPHQKLHSINLYARGRGHLKQRNRIQDIKLTAKWCPAESGWGTRFKIDSGYPKGMRGKYVYFDHYTQGKKYADHSFILQIHADEFSQSFEFDGTRYSINIHTLHHEGLRDLVDSPEAFKKITIAWSDQFKATVEKTVRSGKAVTKAVFIKKKQNVVFPDEYVIAKIPRPKRREDDTPPTPSKRKLTDKEKEKIIAVATKRMIIRKEYILKDYREMHSAMNKAFPLKELFQGLEEKD